MGKSTLVMKADGAIAINGQTIDAVGDERINISHSIRHSASIYINGKPMVRTGLPGVDERAQAVRV